MDSFVLSSFGAFRLIGNPRPSLGPIPITNLVPDQVSHALTFLGSQNPLEFLIQTPQMLLPKHESINTHSGTPHEPQVRPPLQAQFIAITKGPHGISTDKKPKQVFL